MRDFEIRWTGFWGIEWESPSGFSWALENYWDGEGQITLFKSRVSAEKYARKLEKRINRRCRIREVAYAK